MDEAPTGQSPREVAKSQHDSMTEHIVPTQRPPTGVPKKMLLFPTMEGSMAGAHILVTQSNSPIFQQRFLGPEPQTSTSVVISS